jgi:hypothetical protein
MYKISFVFLVLFSPCLFGQNSEDTIRLSKVSGILFFEKHQGGYSMYFVESTITDFNILLEKMDTIKVVTLGGPDDDASNVLDYKIYLDKRVKFKPLTIYVSQENYLGQQFEDSIYTYSKFGEMVYLRTNKHKLSPSYKSVFLNSKVKIFRLEEYLVIRDFIVRPCE